MTEKQVLLDKILGIIYGNALGDAVGLATEFLNKQEAHKLYGEYDIIPFPAPLTVHSKRWDEGDWTDDTDQLILIMQGFIKNKKIDKIDFAKRLFDWMKFGFPELGDIGGMGIGFTVMNVLLSPNFFDDPHEAAQAVWEKYGRNLAANGAVMRTSVLGIIDYNDIEKVIDNTIEICKVTHTDPRCIASCIAITTWIALLLQGCKDSEEMLNRAYQYSIKYVNEEHKDEFNKYFHAKSLKEIALDEPKAIGYTLKCMASALYGIRKNPSSSNDFKRIISDIAMEGGDSDTNACVCGAVMGAMIGYSNLPKDWLSKFPNRKWLNKIVIDFCSTLGFDKNEVMKILGDDLKEEKKVEVSLDDEVKGFAVYPKMDCPHVSEHLNENAISLENLFKRECMQCKNIGENWVCLKCGDVYCSRYIKGHMLQHFEETKHSLSISFSDLSVWCYTCNSYIEDPTVRNLLKKMEKIKFQ